MQRLTEIAMVKAAGGVFTRPEVACWVGGSPQRQFSLLKRAVASGEVVRVHRGFYSLATKYLHQKLDPLVLIEKWGYSGRTTTSSMPSALMSATADSVKGCQ